jgi:ectoine hydroxylase-related dioxygenase (phytanoyl-CoA dioxygenase family)
MVNQQQLDAYNQDGYLSGGRLLTDEQVDQLRGELDRMIALHDHGYSDRVYIDDTAAFCQRRDCFVQITNLRELSAPFRAVAESPVLVEAACRLLGTTELCLFADSMLFKNGHNKAVNEWHQDGPAFDILDRPQAVTAWIALDDVNEDDGCVCFARGSHRWSQTPQEALPHLNDMLAREQVMAPPLEENGNNDGELHRALIKRGEVHFHQGLTWHCSLENRSGKPRRGYAVFCIPTTTRFVANGSHFIKPFVGSRDGEEIKGRHFPRLKP